MSPRLLAPLRIAAVTASLVVAAALTVSAPDDDALQRPIEVRGGVGDRLVARTAEVQAHGVVAARALALDGRAAALDTVTNGVWIAVDVTVGCRLRPCSFASSLLRVGGTTFRPAVLAPTPSYVVLNGEPGLRYRTTAVFEVPRSVLGARADLVAQDVSTQALDSVPVVRLRLPAETMAAAEVVTPTVVGVAR